MNRFRGSILFFSTCSLLALSSLGAFILFSITNTKPGKSKSFFSDIVDTKPYTRNPFNILLLGGDAAAGNTDTMMIVSYDPEHSRVSVLSIPRDTRIMLNGSYQKINSAYNVYGKGKEGMKETINTLNNLIGIKIDHYAFIDLSSFRKVIDILGGTDYDVPCDIKYSDPSQDLFIDLKKGMQHLDGKKAEEFMRFRKPQDGDYSRLDGYYDGSDLKRINAQQGFIKELIKQKATIANATKLKPIASEILSNIITDIDLKSILALALDTESLKSGNIKTFRINVYDSDSFVVFDNQIMDTLDNKTYPANEILVKYFLGTEDSSNSKENAVPIVAPPSSNKHNNTTNSNSNTITNNNNNNNNKQIQSSIAHPVVKKSSKPSSKPTKKASSNIPEPSSANDNNNDDEPDTIPSQNTGTNNQGSNQSQN